MPKIQSYLFGGGAGQKGKIIMTYSSTLALSRSQFSDRNRNSVSFKAKSLKLGPISNTIILVVLASLLGLFYLAQVTKTNAYGFSLNSLQQQQTKLQTEYADLQVSSAQLQSVSRIQNSSVTKSMVPLTPSATAKN
jgi:cell division protein FtsL